MHYEIYYLNEHMADNIAGFSEQVISLRALNVFPDPNFQSEQAAIDAIRTHGRFLKGMRLTILHVIDIKDEEDTALERYLEAWAREGYDHPVPPEAGQAKESSGFSCRNKLC